jgi:hypothetical protein
MFLAGFAVDKSSGFENSEVYWIDLLSPLRFGFLKTFGNSTLLDSVSAQVESIMYLLRYVSVEIF